MKLDVSCMQYLTKEDYRVMEAIELGMRNHELVPVELISSLAKLRHGGIHKFLSNLLKFKLLSHSNVEYNGYRLNYLGYDILALHTLCQRGVISTCGSQIGVGKESDIFECQDDNGNDVVVKIHRLGRTSFRSVRKNRDYMNGKSKASWLFMSRLAAIKEFSFMKALYAHGFPTPVPLDQSRHIVAMSRIRGFPMAQIKAGKMEDAERVFTGCFHILKKLAEHGLVHCDFNEFNLMVDADYNITLIDFPQMVSVKHPNASDLFHRDLNGLIKFFAMKMRYIPSEEMKITLEDIVPESINIDAEVKASGFSEMEQSELSKYVFSHANGRKDDDDEEDDETEDDEEEEEEVEEEEEATGGGAIDEVTTVFNNVSVKAGGGSGASASGSGKHSKSTSKASIVEKEGVVGSSKEGETGGLGEESAGKDEDDSSDDDDDSSDDEDNDNEGGAAASVTLDQSEIDQIKQRARQEVRKKGFKGKDSRNSTKKRNKYGRVDKSNRDLL